MVIWVHLFTWAHFSDNNVLLFLVEGRKLYQENFISSLRQKVGGQRTLSMTSVSHCLQLKKKSTCQRCTFAAAGSDDLHLLPTKDCPAAGNLPLCLALLPRPKAFQYLFWFTISLDIFPQELLLVFVKEAQLLHSPRWRCPWLPVRPGQGET